MSNVATHIIICKLMGVSYTVYCSGHFSKKVVNIFLRPTVVIPDFDPKKNNVIRN